LLRYFARHFLFLKKLYLAIQDLLYEGHIMKKMCVYIEWP
jgi:hypothetical protein